MYYVSSTYRAMKEMIDLVPVLIELRIWREEMLPVRMKSIMMRIVQGADQEHHRYHLGKCSLEK